MFGRCRIKFSAAPLVITGPAMCLSVGVACGLAASLLKWLINYVSDVVRDVSGAAHGNAVVIALPIIGVMLTVVFSYYVMHSDFEYSGEKIKTLLRHGDTAISPKLTYGTIIANALTLGFGGSAGVGGPIANVGASLGSNISRRMGLSDGFVRMMIWCGSAAGVAGVFTAPVGGMLFAVECMGIQLTALSAVAILCTCIVSSLTSYVLSGCVPSLPLEGMVPQDTGYIVAVLLLGLCCGAYALWYGGTGRAMERFLRGLPNRWVRGLVSGAAVGVLLFLFPSLYGEGYDVIASMADAHGGMLGEYSQFAVFQDDGIRSLLLAGAGVLMVKGVAAFGSISGGGVGGDFAPTLFAGAVAGFVFTGAARVFFGVELPVQVFVVSGMAAVMAAVLRAPLMAIFLVVEMTATHAYFLPVAVAAMVSFAVVEIRDRVA